jgi:hypothetical protein
MVMVTKVQYDANSRTLKLVDSEFKTLLEGDALFDLAIPLMFEADELEERVLALVYPPKNVTGWRAG